MSPENIPFRPDAHRIARLRQDRRPPERIRAHYVLERQLTERLLSAPVSELPVAYESAYKALFDALPDHPQHTADRASDSLRIKTQLGYLRGVVGDRDVFAEIGCGDAAVSLALSPHATQTIGIDVTDALAGHGPFPENFRFIKTNGVALNLPDQSVDVVYSNQLMEHLVPSQAQAQLLEIFRVLRPGGRYMCITPSAATGPHDISCYFDYQPTGLHLREYDYRSLVPLMKAAGFHRVDCYIATRGRKLRIPYVVARAAEVVLVHLPRPARSVLSAVKPVRWLMGLFLIARK